MLKDKERILRLHTMILSKIQKKKKRKQYLWIKEHL